VSAESEAVARVAEAYRARGYGVELDTPLPAELGLPASFRADLVAYGPDELVLVEVKRRSALQGDETLQWIARAVAGHPRWRFELVLVPEPPQDMPPMEHATGSESIDDALGALDSAERMAEAGFAEGALLAAFAAGEAVMRSIVMRLDPSAGSSTGLALAKTLVSLGEMEEGDVAWLTSAYRVRNAIAHGFRPSSESDVLRAEAVIAFFRRLAAAKEVRNDD
jgi:hypothetical protein